MHTIEPFYNWRDYYTAEEDERSPFFGREYSEFEFSNTVYNYFIHPQWDDFGSNTLYLKILFADYDKGFAIIELIGEWNDAINNDIMFLKEEVIDVLTQAGIFKFIIVGENVMNFHSSDDSYYEAWQEDISEEDGWIVLLNLPEHLQQEYKQANIFNYVFQQEYPNWRTHKPNHVFEKVEQDIFKRLT